MDFHQIDGFLHLVKSKNVSFAAKKVHISQSALSRQIAALQRELGAPLFKRVAGEMRLTSFGEVFLPEAYRIADDVQHAMCKLKGPAYGRTVLRIGHMPILMSAFIAEAILAYSQEYPDVHIEMTEASTTLQIELLKDGALDVVCTHTVPETGLALNQIARVPLLKVSPQCSGYGYPTESKGVRHSRDLTFLIPDRKQYPHVEMIVREVCRRAGYEPKIAELGGISSLLVAIALGKGISILPAHFCLLPHPGVHYESLSFYMPQGDVVALTQNQSPPESLQRFIALLRKQAGILYRTKFWKAGDESKQIVFPGNDRRTSIRRRQNDGKP